MDSNEAAGNVESGNFTVANYEGLMLFVEMEIDGIVQSDRVNLSKGEIEDATFHEKTSSLVPDTPDKSMKPERKQNSNLASSRDGKRKTGKKKKENELTVDKANDGEDRVNLPEGETEVATFLKKTPHFAPETPGKTITTERKKSSNLGTSHGGKRNNMKSKKKENKLKVTVENAVNSEADDMSMTTQQRPKEKKHRPKVVIQGMPGTPEPDIPKPAASKDTMKSHRKNVLKKGCNKSTPAEVGVEPTDSKIMAPTKKSSTRALNFESEGQPRDDGVKLGPESSMVLSLEMEVSIDNQKLGYEISASPRRTSSRKRRNKEVSHVQQKDIVGSTEQLFDSSCNSNTALTKADDNPDITDIAQENGNPYIHKRRKTAKVYYPKPSTLSSCVNGMRHVAEPASLQERQATNSLTILEECVETAAAEKIMTGNRRTKRRSSAAISESPGKKESDGQMAAFVETPVAEKIMTGKKGTKKRSSAAILESPGKKESDGQMVIYNPTHAFEDVLGGSTEEIKEGTVVPYEGPFDPVGRLHPRAKVYLDEETDRVWKLLLADINSPGVDGADEEQKKWWEEERKVYQGLADSFIERMRLVQGERHFSLWKGSVVDSVVGAFLTQNVTDHLSSSAFMQLVSNFPPKSKMHRPSRSRVGKRIGSKIVNGSQAQKRGSPRLREIRNDNKTVRALDNQTSTENKTAKSSSNKKAGSTSKPKSKRVAKEQREIDWDSIRREVEANGKKRERPESAMDSVDWEAVRCADVDKIAKMIKARGMNQKLAQRIQDCLNRILRDHGSIDLEWLRDIEPDKAKEYLLSIYGMGLKSVECVRLLTLHHLAFPVDTNVGRVAVRLGWVPLQPLPESLQLHLLELYPMMNTIQKYIWPRLCKLEQRTLYELHYQMITFGKVFCTKTRPNCNACPMRGECKHFASAFASSKLALPGPEDKFQANASENEATHQELAVDSHPMTLPLPELLKERQQPEELSFEHSNEPIVEVPATPQPDYMRALEIDIEDIMCEKPEDIPATIELNIEEFTQNLQNYMDNQDGEMSQALVALTPEAASIPLPKLKAVSQLRTQHQVYELPDSHPLLVGLQKREPDDPGHYLLAIWIAGETVDSVQLFERKCNSQGLEEPCNDERCLSCNHIQEADCQTVQGTLLIPCRTAMRGSFPLNGTYFQVNEVFADHDSSKNPFTVPREWLWNLPRRTVYFGTSVTSIFKGLSTEDIQHCFWRGYVCVRGFDRKTRAPRPLVARLHFPTTKSKTKKKEGDNKVSPKGNVTKMKKGDNEASQKSNVKNKDDNEVSPESNVTKMKKSDNEASPKSTAKIQET